MDCLLWRGRVLLPMDPKPRSPEHDLSPPNQTPKLVEHFFRHEYGRVVASLVRKFGAGELELIEDSVQAALALALTSWALKAVPTNPGAWLTRVAHNRVVDHLRRGVVGTRVAEQSAAPESIEAEDIRLASEIADDQLRMLFVCCDERLPQRTQLVLALKTLCGFGVREIALRLLMGEAAVRKRIERGRAQLRELDVSFDSPQGEQFDARIVAVHRVLYLIFTEGYSSSKPQQHIRRELCDEALRLTHLLVDHEENVHPQTWALLALMHFHHARIDARSDGAGELLLLKEQDRSLWNRPEIQLGMLCLVRSGQGGTFSRYHAEAAVLAEHCLAPTYEETRWSEIVELYAMLERISPSPLHTLNRAIAIAEWKGPEEGLRLLQQMTPPAWLARYYLWDATLGELYRRSGENQAAIEHLSRALAGAPTDAEKRRLRQRIAACTQD